VHFRAFRDFDIRIHPVHHFFCIRENAVGNKAGREIFIEIDFHAYFLISGCMERTEAKMAAYLNSGEMQVVILCLSRCF
jgi:hypothetical protein